MPGHSAEWLRHRPHGTAGGWFIDCSRSVTLCGVLMVGCTINLQLFTKQRNSGCKLVNSAVFRISVLDQGFTAREHPGPYDADHLEHRPENGIAGLSRLAALDCEFAIAEGARISPDLMQAGTRDLLLRNCARLYRKMKIDGVDVERSV